jgi:hypothetical protein
LLQAVSANGAECRIFLLKNVVQKFKRFLALRHMNYVSACLIYLLYVLQEIIQEYDEKGVGMSRPRSGHRRQRSGLSEGTASAHARHGDVLDELRGANVRELQGGFSGSVQVTCGICTPWG